MPIGFWIVTLLSQAAIVPLIVWWARRYAGMGVPWTLRVAAILVVWLGSVIALALSGVFQPQSGGPPIIGLAVIAPIVVGTFALLRPNVRAPEGALAVLIGLQVLRVVGFEFVVAGHTGQLPLLFAAPAGWGDAFIGVTAPFVALAVARRTRGWRELALVWNLAGIADLVNAVFLGVTSSPGALQLFGGAPSTELMTRLPLSLIPTFGVPLAVLGHVAALRALRSSASVTTDRWHRGRAADDLRRVDDSPHERHVAVEDRVHAGEEDVGVVPLDERA